MYAHTTGPEAIELAELAGIRLDPWQQTELTHGLGESADWKCPRCTYRTDVRVGCPDHPGDELIHPWAAFEVALVVPRQNGKSELLVARQLAGLFLLGSRLQIYSAHQFDTAMEIFLRLVEAIEDTPELRAQVKLNRGKVGVYSHGSEGITLKSGERIRFKARTGGGGRGFTCDDLYLDEAMILPERFLGATVPTLSAISNPQIWLAGSAPDEDEPTHDGIVLAKRRERALAKDDKSLAYFEHSAEGESPDTIDDAVLDDPEQWALANPALGNRISPEAIENERRAMGTRQFAVERLGITAWPRTDGLQGTKISPEIWAALEDELSTAKDPVCFAVDVNPERTHGVIGLAGRRTDRLGHLEIVERRRHTGWIVERVQELIEAHKPVAVVLEGKAAAGSLLADFLEAGVEVTPVNGVEMIAACGMLYDALDQKAFRHLGEPDLSSAVRGATAKDHDGAWSWSRRNSSVDISPLIAITLAHWGLVTLGQVGTPEVVDLNAVLQGMRDRGEQI